MTHHAATILAKVLHWGRLFQTGISVQKDTGDEIPLRSELFSSAQMEERGKTLAGSHVLRQGSVPERLLKRLAEKRSHPG